MAPRSRGADAVARAAAAPAAAEQAADSEDTAPPGRAARESVVEIHLEGYTPVLDLKGLCAVHPSAGEPLRSFLLLLNCTRSELRGAFHYYRGCITRME
eukprot:2568221-Pleurochrysis_carterae.AAC.1